MSAIAAVSRVRPVAPAREPGTGRFTPSGRLWSIVPVVLPNGSWGWQVGPDKMVFARREHAERFAMVRKSRSVAV